MRKKKNPAAVATASGGGGFDLAERQIGPVNTTERERLQDRPLASPIRIDVAPMAHGKWRATFNGKTLCIVAAPMVKAARILIARGHDPARIIELWHVDADGWALRGRLGPVAATLIDGEKATRPAKNRVLARFPATPAVQLRREGRAR
jgi:hypothetical protein